MHLGGFPMKIRTSVAAGAFAIGLTTLTAAAAAPASFNSGDKIGCHAAWDVHLHGLSGVGIPLATVVADLQVTTVTGTSPYNADATALAHAIVNQKPWKAADRKMVKACGKHH
jgi:hypothetical protein